MTNRFNTCSRISPRTGSCIYGRKTPPGVRILPTISYYLCGNAIKYNNHLKALQKHLSSQFTCLVSWSPAHSTRTFCSLTKWSRFGSKSIHEGEAKLYQTLCHMIPTKHAAQRKCFKSQMVGGRYAFGNYNANIFLLFYAIKIILQDFWCFSVEAFMF